MCYVYLGFGQQKHILETDLNNDYTECEINKCRGLNEPIILNYYSFCIQRISNYLDCDNKTKSIL